MGNNELFPKQFPSETVRGRFSAFLFQFCSRKQTKKKIKLVSDTEKATAQVPSSGTWEGPSVKNLDQS